MSATEGLQNRRTLFEYVNSLKRQIRSTTFMLAATLALVDLAVSQETIPIDVIKAWERLPSNFDLGPVVLVVMESVRENKIMWHEKIKRLNGGLLVESRFYDRPVRKIVRGPKQKFVFDEIEGSRNGRSIVSVGDQLANEWDGHLDRAEGWMSVPFEIYKVPFKKFFDMCSMVRVLGVGTPEMSVEYEMTDAEGSKIWKNCSSFKGIAKFDSMHDYRLSELRFSFVNQADVTNNSFLRILYDESKNSSFVIEEGDGVEDQVIYRTTVSSLPEVPEESEFLPETYGIVVGSSVVSWWQRPAVWLVSLAAFCFCVAGAVKYRRNNATKRV